MPGIEDRQTDTTSNRKYGMRISEIMVVEATASEPETEQIRDIASNARRELDSYYDEPFWSVSNCLAATNHLVQILINSGFPAVRRGGYYKCCEPTYRDIVRQHSLDPDLLDPEDFTDDWDGSWKHWWVSYKNLIIDITADQFHPSDPAGYRVIVTTIANPCYSS